jgi:hypothetical protein
MGVCLSCCLWTLADGIRREQEGRGTSRGSELEVRVGTYQNKKLEQFEVCNVGEKECCNGGVILRPRITMISPPEDDMNFLSTNFT